MDHLHHFEMYYYDTYREYFSALILLLKLTAALSVFFSKILLFVQMGDTK